MVERDARAPLTRVVVATNDHATSSRSAAGDRGGCDLHPVTRRSRAGRPAVGSGARRARRPPRSTNGSPARGHAPEQGVGCGRPPARRRRRAARAGARRRRAARSPGGGRRPERPPERGATTGTPDAAASRSAWQQVSRVPGCTSRSKVGSTAVRSPVPRVPVNFARGAAPRASPAAGRRRRPPGGCRAPAPARRAGVRRAGCAGCRRTRRRRVARASERARDQRSCSQVSRSAGVKAAVSTPGRPERGLAAEVGDPVDHPAGRDQHLRGALGDPRAPVVGGDVEQR